MIRMANEIFDKEFGLPIQYADSLESVVDSADELVLLTSLPEFKQNEKLVTSKRLFDFRYYFAGLSYFIFSTWQNLSLFAGEIAASDTSALAAAI